ncbi:MAG: LCP family protein [Nocardioidaceae bacterium]
MSTAQAATGRATPAQVRHTEVSRVRFRRALSLLLMTLVLPGSAQLVAGRRRVGRIALRVVLGCIVAAVAVLLLSIVSHSFAFWLASNTFLLGVLRIALAVLALGWAYLFVDAWRLGQPLGLMQRQRLWMVGINSTLMVSTMGVLFYGAHLVGVQRDFIATMFGHGISTPAHDGRYNVLLLGGDSGATRWGMRPDSITVASIDADTGKTVLFGLPRNMTNFPFAKGSVMAEQFPGGFDCDGCELNGVATWAQDHKSLFPDGKKARAWGDPGIVATASAVEGITGLKLNYYALVNLQGFRSFVNAMGGLTLNVREPIPIGRIGDITGYVKPGIRKLNGYQTLWYARSRAAADDYSRMARQKCVMNAMLHQLTPSTVVRNFEGIAKATTGLISTNLPASELDNFAQLALKAKAQPVRTVSFVPPAINTGDPDIGKIRAMTQKVLQAKSGTGSKSGKGKSGSGFSQGAATTTGGSKGNIQQGYNANAAADLSDAC